MVAICVYIFRFFENEKRENKSSVRIEQYSIEIGEAKDHESEDTPSEIIHMSENYLSAVRCLTRQAA